MAKFSFSAAVHADIGTARTNNEDNFYFAGSRLTGGGADRSAALTHRADGCGLYAVFDGMGGEDEGEFASRCAAEALAECAEALSAAPASELDGLVNAFLERANGRICARSQTHGSRTGSTVALLLCRNDGIYAWNVGDSRIYYQHKGVLRQLSADHTEAARLVRIGELTEEQARTDARKHRLTRHLGIPAEDVVLSPHRAEPVKPAIGDRLLLCSDGLTDVLPDATVGRLLDAWLSPAETAKTLVREALRADTRDNVTALVVQVEKR